MERYFSVHDAARMLGGVSIWTVRAWLSQGRLQRTKIGRRTMVSETALENFVRGNEGRSRSAREDTNEDEAQVGETALT